MRRLDLWRPPRRPVRTPLARRLLRSGLRALLDHLDHREGPNPDDRLLDVLQSELDDLHDRIEIMWRELDLDLDERGHGPSSASQSAGPPPPAPVPHPLAWTIASTLRPAPGHDYPPVGVAFQELSVCSCPTCGARINALTSWGDAFQPEMPKVMICGVCAKPFRVDDGDDHALVALTTEEIEGLDPQTRDTMDALRQMLNQ